MQTLKLPLLLMYTDEQNFLLTSAVTLQNIQSHFLIKKHVFLLLKGCNFITIFVNHIINSKV